MPRFFFHFRDQNGFKKDKEGQDLPDVQAAHAEALKTAQELWSDLPPEMAGPDKISIEIADETGETVLTWLSWRPRTAWQMAQPSLTTKEVERTRIPVALLAGILARSRMTPDIELLGRVEN